MKLTEKYRVSAHLPESLLTWGTVEVVSDEILTAGESCDLAVRVAVERAISAGSSIEVWTHFVSDLARVQAEDPDQPAYFSCESDGPAYALQIK